MVIKRSTAPEVATLLQDLRTGPDGAREAAAARLSVIGTRAVDGLLAVLASEQAPGVRAAALAALEAIGDPRAIEPAFALLAEADPAVALPAAGVLRGALETTRGTEVLDRLATTALDPGAPERARLAALEALRGLSPKVIGPIWRTLKDDSSPAVRGAVGGGGPTPEIDPTDALRAAAAGDLPDDPDAVRRWLGGDVASLSLPVLHRLVQTIRAREAAMGDPARRVAWMTARAAVHRALAARGSRVALYDLREMIDAAPAAPVEMLAALERVGDASCLEPIAAAYARLAPGRAAGDDGAPSRPTDATTWWRQHLATTFRAIAAREKLTERQVVVRRIRSRWPDAGIDLLGVAKK